MAVYKSAANTLVKDEGSRHFCAKSLGMKEVGCIRTRVGQVSRKLMVVVDLVDSGHQVVFEKEGDVDVSRVTHKATSRAFKCRRANKVYEADFELQPFSCSTRGRGSSI